MQADPHGEIDAHIGLLTLDLYMGTSASLKEKRRILHGITQSLRARLDVSVAEVGAANLRQRAFVAVVCVGSNRGYVERVLNKALSLAESKEGAQVCGWQIEWL